MIVKEAREMAELRRSPIPIETFSESELSAPAARALPPKVFTSPEFYEFELEAIWGQDWFCIGRVSDIPNSGDYRAITVGDESLVMLRDALGNVRVLSNVCQHRAMLLLEGAGNVKRIRCPLHSWVYSLEGKLVSAPGPE